MKEAAACREEGIIKRTQLDDDISRLEHEKGMLLKGLTYLEVKLERATDTKEELMELPAMQRKSLMELIAHLESELSLAREQGAANSLDPQALACRQQRDYIFSSIRDHANHAANQRDA